MRTHWIIIALFVFGAVSSAWAGGPPPMYVVVEKVILEPGASNPGWVQIWGCITRRTTDSDGNATEEFSRPTYGYLFLSIEPKGREQVQAELQEWKKATGTGKAVAIGACEQAGTFLKCTIYQPTEKAKVPAAVYSPGHLKTYGDLYATRQLAQRPEVVALLKFASERK